MGHRASQQQLLGVRCEHGRQPHDRPGTSIRQEIRFVSLRDGRQPGGGSPILLSQHVELLASRHRGARLGDGRQPRMGRLGLGTPLHDGMRTVERRCASVVVHRPGGRHHPAGHPRPIRPVDRPIREHEPDRLPGIPVDAGRIRRGHATVQRHRRGQHVESHRPQHFPWRGMAVGSVRQPHRRLHSPGHASPIRARAAEQTPDQHGWHQPRHAMGRNHLGTRRRL